LGQHDVIGERAEQALVELLFDGAQDFLREDWPVLGALPGPAFREQALPRRGEEGGEQKENEQEGER
jgi:hypothetical protein